MLIVVVGDTREDRKKHIASVVSGEGEVLRFDETQGILSDLEQYIYPSLFVQEAPVILVQYMLSSEQLTTAFLQKLLASPSIFIFEEIELPTSTLTLLKKAGAVLYTQDKKVTPKKEADIFGVTLALTASDKKKRWMAYREALVHHPVEALLGILYWKVRDLYTKSPAKKNVYHALYRSLLAAHAAAWKSGTPLELAIEKVILTH